MCPLESQGVVLLGGGPRSLPRKRQGRAFVNKVFNDLIFSPNDFNMEECKELKLTFVP